MPGKSKSCSGGVLIIDFKRVYQKKDCQGGYVNALKLFHITDYEEVDGEKYKYFYKNATIMQIVLYFWYRAVSRLLKRHKIWKRKFQLKMQPLMNRHNLFYIEQGYFDYDFSGLNRTKVIYICGCFECSRYFDDVKSELQEIFDVEITHEANVDLMDKMKSSESVSVSIRRGDFVTDKNNRKVYDVCGIAYFNEAVKIMIEKLGNPTFFVFSDDMEWAMEHIDFCGCRVYRGENKEASLAEQLALRTQCKNYIICNSTFSWWGQYLCKNDNKIVVSPSRWYKVDLPSDLIEDRWIKIDVDSFR